MLRLLPRQLRLTREAVPTIPFDPDGNYVGKGALQSLGYRTFTVTDTVSNVGPAPAGTTVILIRIEGGQLRFRDDGTMPTATVGFPLYTGDVLEYDAITAKFWAIRVSGSPILHALFYGYQG